MNSISHIYPQDNTKPSTPNRDELTIIFIITFKFRLYPLEVNSAISSTSSPSASSSSTSSSWSSSASLTQKDKKSFSKWIHFTFLLSSTLKMYVFNFFFFFLPLPLDLCDSCWASIIFFRTSFSSSPSISCQVTLFPLTFSSPPFASVALSKASFAIPSKRSVP